MNHAQHSARNKPNKISLVIVLPPVFLKFPFLTLVVLFSRLRFVLTVIILYHIMQTMSIENDKNIIQIANDIFV